jgi:hypothetical protein
MAKAKSKDLLDNTPPGEVPVVKESNLPSTQMAPARGFEYGHDQEDMLTPRTKLLQDMSPECTDHDKDGVPGAIINSITGEELPQIFIPIFHSKNFVKFNARNKKEVGFDPQHELGAVIWSTTDASDPQVLKECKFQEDGSPPTAVAFFNFFSLFKGQKFPIVVSFAKTSFKTGRKLYNLAKYAAAEGVDMFGRQYKLVSKQVSNDSGTFYVLDVEPAGIPSEEDHAKAEQLWEMFHERKADIEMDLRGSGEEV